jgi:hypothetical protein
MKSVFSAAGGTIMTKGRILIRLSSLNARGCYILAIFLIGFGLLQITGINFLQDSHVPGIIESAACFVLLNLGYAVSSFYINKKPGLLSKLLTRAVIPSAIALPAFFLAPGSLFKIYFALFTVIFYISGYRSGITDDYSILGSRRIYIGVGIFAVFMILAKYHDYFHGYFNVLAGLAAFFCITAIIITNQKTLDYNIYVKRGVDASGVQKKLRSYNIKALILIMLIIILMFNAKGIVVEAYKIAIQITTWIIFGFFYIMGLLYPMSEGTGGEETGSPDMGLPKGESGNPLVSTILTIIVVIVCAAILIWVLPRFVRAFIEKMKSVWNKLAIFFRNFFAIKNTDMKLEFEEFVDHVEIIKEARDNRDAKRKSRAVLRGFKHVNDPILRIRHIYRTIIYSYKDILGISRSDTAGEILDKSRKLGIDTEFGEITDTYEKARYGGIAPSEESLKQSEAFARQSVK